MGKKGKKSLANKLAKMSDEDRAKYLQRKADAEEEVKRRREQLIATFVKNKLKKEDGYARLNLAKINQHWHQILRRQKCKQMREEVENLRKWITRVYSLKDKIIEKLVEELEEAEQQYRNNFQAHVIHIDEIIDQHGKYMETLRLQYEMDRDQLIESLLIEKQKLIQKASENEEYLRMLIYGNEEETNKIMKENREQYVDKIANMIAAYEIEYEETKKELKSISYGIAKQISSLSNEYIKRTNPKRAHYQILLKFDTESAIAIRKDQDRIRQEQELSIQLENEFCELKKSRERKLEIDRKKLQYLKKCLYTFRKKIFSDMKLDEKMAIILTEHSNDAINHLETIAHKGEIILKLVGNCNKLETESEEVLRWSLLNRPKYLHEDTVKTDEELKEKSLYEGSDIECPEKNNGEEDYYFQKINVLYPPFERTKTDVYEFFELSSPQTSSTVTEIATETEPPKPLVISGIQLFRSKNHKPRLQKSAQRSPSKHVVSSSAVTIRNKTAPSHVRQSVNHSLNIQLKHRDKPLTIKKIQKANSELWLPPSKRLPKIGNNKPQSAPACMETYKKPTGSNGKTNSVIIFDESCENILNDFESLNHMDNFWRVYNNVKIQCLELNNEKRLLLEESILLKDKVRQFLSGYEIDRGVYTSKLSASSSDSGIEMVEPCRKENTRNKRLLGV